MSKGFRSRLSWLIVPASLVCLALAASYVLGQQANRDRQIEIEVGEPPHSTEAESQLDKADALRRQLRLDKALNAYQRIVDGYPNTKQMRTAHLHAAHVFADRDVKEMYEEAIARYEAFIEKYPQTELTWEAMFHLGKSLHLGLYHEEAASSVYQALIVAAPDTQWARSARILNAYIQLMHQGIDANGMIELCLQLDREATEAGDNDTLFLARYMTAYVHWIEQRYEYALELAHQAESDFDDLSRRDAASLHYFTGILYETQGSADEARSHYRKALDKFPLGYLGRKIRSRLKAVQ